MPDGFFQIDEACLDKAAGLLPLHVRNTLRDWWLVVSPRATTPTFDIASSCTVEGDKGLLLVEAKAHTEELNKEVAGKELRPHASQNSCRNHHRIGECILEANAGLEKSTGLTWELSRDRCYQMTNRFAWSWKLAALGFPVILVYLGFLNADEMKDQGNSFASQAEWDTLVKEHSRSMFPAVVWNKRLDIHGRAFVPRIRSLDTPFDAPTKVA